MTNLLIKIVKSKYQDDKQRSAFGIQSGIVGIICNALLCLLKFIIGAVTKSVSITADAVNNLTDAVTNIVTITGTKLSQKPVDKEHPFGHGRIEYISALIISLSIFIMCFEISKSAVMKILHPTRLNYSGVYIIILVAAIIVKLWMAYYNSKLYKLTDNMNIKAISKDSLNDCIATFATLVSLIMSEKFKLYAIDGYIGICVAVFIFISGLEILNDAVGSLLGASPPKETVQKIEEIICENDLVIGVHDIIVHSYGHNNYLASAHAEVPCDSDLIHVHNVLDSAEKKIKKEMNIEICIHADPVDTENKKRSAYLEKVSEIIKMYNALYSLHDFRMSEEFGINHISFDLVIPFSDIDKTEITNDVTKLIKETIPNTEISINTEHSYN